MSPLSHDYADLFANLVASLELCATTIELWEIWKNKLKDENKFLVFMVALEGF